MSSRSENDAAFYETIHGLLKDQDPHCQEQRQHARQEYEVVQMVAQYDGQLPPAQEDFHLLQFHDISPNGFSFYSPTRPDHPQLIIALGRAPFTFFVAEVRHVEKDDRQGAARYLVGCRFLRKF